ncbi:O-antigen ligase family protein [Vibrio sinaloensis]|uniref:O-antigen ligase family protein n=1 Tax=Photobacterium sp. (strain ATCC 43367) TaxID=379097 RepID=UPI0035EBF34B
MTLNRISFYSLLTLMFWLPLPLASNRIWAWSIAGLFVGFITLCTLFSYYRNINTFPFARIKQFYWLLIPMILFQLWVSIQLLPLPQFVLSWVSPVSAAVYESVGLNFGTISLDAFSTSVGLVKGVVYCLFVLCAIVLIDSVERVKLTLAIMLASGTYQALYAAFEVLLTLDYTPIFGMKVSDRANGTFIYHNHLANYLMMCLSLGAGLLVSQLHVSPAGSWHVRIQRWVSGVISSKMFVRSALVVMVIALVMTRSRMGNTAFFVATLIGGLAALLFYKHKPRALLTLVISLLVVDTLVVGSLFGLAKVKDRIEKTAISEETRDEVLRWSVDLIEAAPLTGTGLGSFYSTFPSVSKSNIGFYDHAHNEYFQFAVEVGIPATLMLGIMCFSALYLTVKAMRTRTSKTLKGTALGCFMAIIGMLIHISVDFNLQPSANAMSFLLVLVLSGVAANLPRVGSPQFSGEHNNEV